MVSHFQKNGHTQAKTDPLEMEKHPKDDGFTPEHWQLNVLESLDSWPLDYRITESL
jgi:2-oxoglutarate dehydrogenase complex dehydrogenase (E1) component-like enzyme